MPVTDLKLILILKSLTPDEFSKLKKYVYSPYFNNSLQIIKLFDYLEKKYPTFSDADKEQIFDVIYPGEKYKDKKVRDILSRLNELVENFMGQIEFDKRELLGKTFTLRQLKNKDLQKHFLSVIKESEKKLENQPLRGSNYLFDKYSLFKEKREYLQQIEKIGKSVSLYEDITKEIDYFTNYAIHKILDQWLFVYGSKSKLKYNYEFKILDKIVDFMNENPENENPGIIILYKMRLLELEPDNDKIYFEIKDLLKKNITSIETEQKRRIFVDLYNYTKLRAIKSNAVFRVENYSLLKESIKIGMYPKDRNYFYEDSYITVAATALMYKDFDWAQEFMEKHKSLLDPVVRENAYNYCKAVFDYRTGNFGSALKRLARVSIDDFSYHHRVKIHQLKIYYESGDFEMAKNVIDSFRHFLHSSKLFPDFIKLRFVNFVNFTSRVINVQLGGDVRNLIEIEREIRATEPVKLENKLWLLDQISKIKK